MRVARAFGLAVPALSLAGAAAAAAALPCALALPWVLVSLAAPLGPIARGGLGLLDISTAEKRATSRLIEGGQEPHERG